MAQIFILHWASSSHLYPNYFTVETVKSIRELTDYPYKLTIIDNYSDLEAFNDLKAKLPDVEIIRNDRTSQCVNSGRNKIWSLVDSEYFVLLHTDIRVSKGWLSNLLAELNIAERQFDKPCVISPRYAPYMLSDEKLYSRFKDHFTVNSLEALRAYCNKYSIPFKNGVIHSYPFGHAPFTNSGSQLMMFVASKWFRDAVGEWDELYEGANYDDCDMGLTAILKGCKNLQSQTVFLQHLQGVSYGHGHLVGDNSQRFIEKWGKQMFDEMGDAWIRLHREHP